MPKPKSLSADVVQQPFENVAEVALPAKHLLVQPGDQQLFAWLIIDGLVRQYDILESGAQITLNIYKPGSVLSLSWLFGSSGVTHFYESLTSLKVRKVNAQEYTEFIASNPSEAIKILQRLSSGLDGYFSRMTVMASGDAKTRIMNEIRIESARFNQFDDQGNPFVELRTSQIANRTGLAPETVSRGLSQLKADMKITKLGKIITIL